MHHKLQVLTGCLASLCLVSCVSLKRSPSSSSADRSLASQQPLITFCATDTGAASTPEEKKWRDAFSLEVLERICNKEVEVAKRRIDYSNWIKSKYLETSWDYGIDLTGVEHGWPRGTLITSRHMLSTQHLGHHPHVGDTIWFLTLDNRMISRKVIGLKYLDTADLAVTRLDSDVPGSVHPLKVLDPEAAKVVPDRIPVLRIEQQFKALLVDKIRSGFGVPGNEWGEGIENPGVRAYAQYYQHMIRFDSSSPSILILRNEYGVMPILYSLVSFSGTGDGPLVHWYLPEIQSAIQSFGDSHLLQKAMPPVTPFSAPACSISVSRASDGHTCNLTVQGSAEPVTGNPVVSPGAPTTWTANGNQWTGSAECPSDPTTVFEATLSGPGGTGRTCESAAIGPVLPQCQLSVSRRGSSTVCDVTVTKLIGNPTQNPVLAPNNPSDWFQSGDSWTGTTSCALNSVNDYSAKLTDGLGEGPQCKASVGIYSDVPTCELTSRRIDYSDTCELTVNRKSGIVSGNPSASPITPNTWTRNGDEYKGTVACPAEEYSTFSATFSGPLGAGSICKSPSVLPVTPEIGFCELSAVRQGLTNLCTLKTTYVRGWGISPPPVASPRNPSAWKHITGTTADFEGTASCAYNAPTQFSAYYPSYRNIPGRVCVAAPVEKIPAPACNLSVIRQGTTNRCTYRLSAGSVPGTIALTNFNGSTTRTAWNGSSPLTGTFTCSQIVDSAFNAYVWGPGAGPQTASCRAVVPKLPPPSCQLTAQRRNRTGICDITLTGSGVIDTSKAPKMNPYVGGRWSGSVWRGTASCATNRATTYSASIFGVGGSQASCTSNVVPRL